MRNIDAFITDEYPQSDYLYNQSQALLVKMFQNKDLLKRPLNSASFCWTFPQECEDITASLLAQMNNITTDPDL